MRARVSCASRKRKAELRKTRRLLGGAMVFSSKRPEWANETCEQMVARLTALLGHSPMRDAVVREEMRLRYAPVFARPMAHMIVLSV